MLMTDCKKYDLKKRLKAGDVVFVKIVQHRIYKIHLVEIDEYSDYDAALIINAADRKLYNLHQKLFARVLRVNSKRCVDLVPL
ncbi:hypothetical protein Gyru_ORF42 [Gynaephora ruoergensis nucleopolyhedrovirus]|nr:hypothetical protein Gyru_ORF42 [Gynaephora ruoergensis nucleopolyhedrovirus]